MKSTKILLVAISAAALMTFSSLALAVKPSERNTLVAEAISQNMSGPFAGAFDTLIAVLLNDAAFDPEGSIIGTLTGNGQYTVFAPTDSAFDKLFALAACNGITLSDALVRDVVRYHIVKGRRDAEDVLMTSRFRTLLGERFFQADVALIDIAGQEVGFVATDVEADNGIIHAIDRVLLPVEIDLGCAPH